MTATLPRRAYLGAELPGDADAFTRDGVRIAGVAPGSMAERAGLVAGDVMQSIAGAPVRDLRELAAALRLAGAQTSTEIVTSRARTEVEVVHVPYEPGASYGELTVDGARLRTIATHAAPARGLVVFLQGIACESIDHAVDADAPLAVLIAALTGAGYDTLRFDKRGVGDSEGGPCTSTDFHTELADARSVLEYARRLGVPIVLFGHSVGGIIAAQLASPELAGIIVYGTPVMRWLDCLLDSIERQLVLRGASTDAIEAELAQVRNLAKAGELNGRSAAYHEQLHALDLEAAWQAVSVPVLVLRGEHDWVVRADDQARIAQLAADASIVDLPALDHLFGKHVDRDASLRDYGIGAADDAIARASIAWLDRLRSNA